MNIDNEKYMAWLGKKRQEEIDQAIEDILQKTSSVRGNVDLISLSKELGLAVKYAPFLDAAKGVSGVIKYSDPPTIYIKKSLNMERQRFTLAHEIGHYVLHKKEGVDFRVDNLDYSEEDTIQETEANYFAGVLLLPRNILLKAKENGLSKGAIAKIFGVSETVVDVRLRWVMKNS
jgi:Zn-dependent peptidase ImmA (M78 family)